MKPKMNNRMRSAWVAILLILNLPGYAQSAGGTFTAGPLMDRTRIEPFLATLADGRVAAFGGRETGFVSSSYADFYSPGTNTYTEVPMNYPHDYTYVVKLADGRYYIIGGAMNLGVAPGYSSCEMFDPSGNTFTPAGSMNYARMWVAAAQLTSGRVLIAGAWYDNTAAAYAEYYDTGSHTYTTLSSPLVQACAGALMLPTADGGATLFGGFPTFGGTDYTRVEYYSPTDNTFHSVSAEILSSDPGWLVSGAPYQRRPYTDYQLTNGKYLVLASRAGEYGLITFDPSTKTFERIATSTPIMNDLTNGGFYDMVVDRVGGFAYLLGVDSGYDPMRVSLTAVNLNTGYVYHPSATYTLPASEYPIPTLAFMPSNGKILLEGISSTSGDYFHATDKTYLVTPQPALGLAESQGSISQVVCYPNPANDQLNFRFETGRVDDAEITLYDIMGRIIDHRQAGAATDIVTIPVGQLPAGLYLYEVRCGGNITRDKFVKD